jgi:hypothetical protein
MVVLSVAYFYPQFQGKTINQSDITQYNGMAQEFIEYREETGISSLWTGSMFSGMPTIQISSPTKGNFLLKIEKLLNLGFARPVGYFIFGMICYYILLISLGVNSWLSLIGSIAFAFGTGYLGLYEAGHTSKIRVVFASPPIIAGLILIFKEKYLIGGVLFSLFLGISVGANHPQMLYYLAIVLAFPTLIYIVKGIKEGKYQALSKQLGILLIGTVLSLGASASKVLPTLDYSKSTMRGKPILEKDPSAPITSSNTEGLDFEYAMNWSNNASDLLSSFIPYAVGGGSAVILKDDAFVIKKAPALKNQPLPLYWGGLPSTSMPYYFGALVFFLFVLGAVIIKGPTKWWILTGVIFTMLMSLGKNFEVFNRLLFDVLPMFNKFRTPNSVLTVTNIFIPLLGILALQKIITHKKKEELIKPLFYAFFGIGGVALLLVVLGNSLFDFSSQMDDRIGQIAPWMQETRSDYLVSSSLRSIVIMGIGFGLIYFYLKGKIGQILMFAGIGLVTVFDLFSIGSDYLGHSDFVTQRNIENNFTPRQVDNQILADSDPHYRVLDITSDPFNNAMPSYFHKTIGGYSPVKLQRFEDIKNKYLVRNFQPVLNMLNTKYYITNGGADGAPSVSRNPNALGNAWFVKNIMVANNPNEEFDGLESFDPASTAIISSEYESELTAKSYSGNGSITLESYAPNKLVYSSNSNENQLAVFSEVWYEPGWHVTVDGQSADMLRANYILRALPLSAGSHEIIFDFMPSSFKIGVMISYICSILLLGGLLGFLFYKFYWADRKKTV